MNEEDDGEARNRDRLLSTYVDEEKRSWGWAIKLADGTSGADEEAGPQLPVKVSGQTDPQLALHTKVEGMRERV